jgi:hypothetical protein
VEFGVSARTSIGLFFLLRIECSDSGSWQGGAMRERFSEGIFGKHVMPGKCLSC